MKDRRRPLVVMAWILSLILVGTVAFFAARWTLTPPEAEDVERPLATLAVTTATIGSSISVSVDATWPSEPAATNAIEGTVTDLLVEGATSVSEGDALFAVDLRPVTVAHGDVPSFRALSRQDVGRDVEQLEAFLSRQGYFSPEPDNTFTLATERAVKAWQKDMGLAQSGIVEPGDLVYLSDLPATVELDESVQVGNQIASGSELVFSVGDAPMFSSTLNTGARSSTPPLGAHIEISGPSGPWVATVAAERNDEHGNLTLELVGLDGATVCGDQCDEVPISREPARYPGQAIIVPEVDGPAVPLSALGTDATGASFVTAVDGTRIPVEVVASDGSHAIVDGVAVGDEVRLYAVEGGEESVTPTPAPSP